MRSVGLLTLALLVTPLLLGASSPSSNGCNGFDGTWKTHWTDGGPVILKLAGEKGTYDWKDGQVTGTVDGDTLKGTYSQNDGQTGTFKFTLSSDGNSIDGYYKVVGTTDEVKWTGTCTGP